MLLCEGRFEGIVGSDLERGGMFLEVSETPYNALEIVLEIFYSDATNKFSMTLFKENVVSEVIEEAVKTAKERLVPVNS
ncbi:MAG TPA: hypothetical protein VIL74_15550 [Pyrinomonadaceae bacterium]|jgi:hypothetical protein